MILNLPKDLRLGFYLIYAFKDEDISKKSIIQTKQEIRAYLKRKSDRRCVYDDCYGTYVMLIELPDYIQTEEDAVGWFEENEYIPSYYSMYDCTGRHFTKRYKVCKRRGKYFIYHTIGIDI